MNDKYVKVLIGLLIISMLAIAGNVMADDIIGSVDVKNTILTDLNVPTTDPTIKTPFSVALMDTNKFSTMTYAYVDIWHESVSLTAPANATHRYTTTIKIDTNSIMTNPEGWINEFTRINLYQGKNTSFTFEANMTLQAIAEAGTWYMRFRLRDVDINLYDINTTFTVNNYVEFSISESSFSFGDVVSGSINIPITIPTSGYLSLSISSNVLTKLQVCGTNPTDGTNSFSVSNIKIYDADNVGVAQILTTTLTDLNSIQYKGSQTAQVYLWISVPVGTPIGTYSFTLTVSLVSV